jgi:hypothetical protein
MLRFDQFLHHHGGRATDHVGLEPYPANGIPGTPIRLTLRQYFFILLIFILTVSAMDQKNPLPS